MRFKILVSSSLLTTLLALGCGSGGTTYGTGTAGSGGTPGTAGSGGSGGSAATFMAIDPCPNMTSYVTGVTTVTTTEDFKYSPACLKVTAGTTVVIQASDVHPLVGLTTGSANNPIPAGPSMGTQMITFGTPGFYPFKCNIHVSIGMTGVVWVQ